MSKLRTCTLGGGKACRRQGGDGSLQHTAEYIHPFVHPSELSAPVGGEVRVCADEPRTVLIKGLESSFHDEEADVVVSLPIEDLISVDQLCKSMYDIDLDSSEGALRLLELLPIMDVEILKDIAQEIWVGYVVTEEEPELLRAEIKGYLMDYLQNEKES